MPNQTEIQIYEDSIMNASDKELEARFEALIEKAKAGGWSMKRTDDGRFYLARPDVDSLLDCGTHESTAWNLVGGILLWSDLASLGLE